MSPTAFHDLHDYVEIPRTSALRLSPDGRRLVAVVSEPAPDRKTFVTALWQLDPGGRQQPRRLTRSVPGEANPELLPDGWLVFISRRPDPETDKRKPGTNGAAMWLLPAGGGEARQIAAPPGGAPRVAVARDAGTIASGRMDR